MRTILIAALLTGCSGADSTADACGSQGELEQQCQAIVDRYCCGIADDQSRADCLLFTHGEVCGIYGKGSNPPCRFESGEFCVRTSVNFAACRAALDAIGGDCIAAVAPFPSDCKSDVDTCDMTPDCAEQAEPWNGVTGGVCSEVL